MTNIVDFSFYFSTKAIKNKHQNHIQFTTCTYSLNAYLYVSAKASIKDE